MATRDEYKAEIQRLKEENEKLKLSGGDTSGFGAENVQLKTELTELKKNYRMLEARHKELQAVSALSDDSSRELQRELQKRDMRIEVLEAQLEAKAELECASTDHVAVDGYRYKIEHRNIVKEFFEDYKKRFVPEDWTAILIHKKGG